MYNQSRRIQESLKSLLALMAIVALISTGCTMADKKTDQAATDKETTATETAALKSKALKGEIVFGCKVGKDTRLVSVDKTSKRCEVYYQKFGESSQVAWAEATPSLCGDVKNKIKTNIEAKGFTCSEEIAKNHINKTDTAKVKFTEVQ